MADEPIEVLFTEAVRLNNGELITVEAHGISRAVTMQDILIYMATHGLRAEDVKLTPTCSCDGDCCNIPNQYIELSWKADRP